MSKIQKVTGNYIELLKKMFPDAAKTREDCVKDCVDVTWDILKDLDRQPFFPSNKKSYEDHIAAWLASTVSKSYTQGNMNASFYELIIQNFLLQEPKKQDDQNIQTPPDNGEELFTTLLNGFKLAYFDDEGVPCGVSIVACEGDPSLWTASVIRNTTAEPKDREVLVLSSRNLMNVTDKDEISTSDARTTLFTFLRSQALVTKIGKDIFTDVGNVDIKKLKKLEIFSKNLLQGCQEKIEPLRQMYQLKKEMSQLIEKYNKNSTLEMHQLEKEKRQLIEKYNKNYELEAVAKQSFFDRHAKSMAVAALGFAVLISTALILTGVLAPLGLVLAGGIAITLGAVVSAAAGAAVLGSGVKIALDERSLLQYQLNRDKQYQEICGALSEEIKPNLNRAPENTVHNTSFKTVWDSLLSSSPSPTVGKALHEETPVPVVNASSSVLGASEEEQSDTQDKNQAPGSTGPK